MEVVVFVAQVKPGVKQCLQRYCSLLICEPLTNPKDSWFVSQHCSPFVSSHTIILRRSCWIVKRGINRNYLDTFRKPEVCYRWKYDTCFLRKVTDSFLTKKHSYESALRDNDLKQGYNIERSWNETLFKALLNASMSS